MCVRECEIPGMSFPVLFRVEKDRNPLLGIRREGKCVYRMWGEDADKGGEVQARARVA